MDPVTAMMLMQLGIEGNKATYDMLTESDQEKRIKDLQSNPEMDAGKADVLRQQLMAPVNKQMGATQNKQERFLAATGASDGAQLAASRDAVLRQGAESQQNVALQIELEKQKERERKLDELRALQAAEKAETRESIDRAVDSAATTMQAYGENKAAEKDFAKFGSKLDEIGIKKEADVAAFTRAWYRSGENPERFAEMLNTDPVLVEIQNRLENKEDAEAGYSVLTNY